MYFVRSFVHSVFQSIDYCDSFDVANSNVACGRHNRSLLQRINANWEQTEAESVFSRWNWKLQSSSLINSPQSSKLQIFCYANWFNHMCYSNCTLHFIQLTRHIPFHIAIMLLPPLQINCIVNFVWSEKFLVCGLRFKWWWSAKMWKSHALCKFALTTEWDTYSVEFISITHIFAHRLHLIWW